MYNVEGNVQGIKNTVINTLESLFDFPSDPYVYISEEALQLICSISCEYNREIALYVSRSGSIVHISVGRDNSVDLKRISLRRGDSRLSGIRCIHTHPNGIGILSNVDTSALITLKLDAITAIGTLNGIMLEAQTAVINNSNENGFELLKIVDANKIPHELWLSAIEEADKNYVDETNKAVQQRERVMLVGIEDHNSLYELKALAETADVDIVDIVLQKRPKPDTATYIGEGKVEEISRLIQVNNIDCLICDDEISGVMQKNLENTLNIKVIDRTALILDIFAKHSKSAESKLQVESAQLKYRSQRLIGRGIELSRLGGGIGTRGPGESKLEVDRRRIQQRLAFLDKEIENISAQRGLRRKEREKANIPVIALVGYTNAGKSSLLNALTGAQAYVEDKLFATLDSLTRKLKLNNGQEVLVVDTVGFIRKLPHFLVKTFSSTLEEAALSDLIVIVLDGADAEADVHYNIVQKTLEQIKAVDQPRIVVLNKCDRYDKSNILQGLVISAKTGEGLDDLQNAIIKKLEERFCTVRIELPFSEFSSISIVHEKGKVLSEEYTEHGVNIKANLPNNIAKKLGMLHNVNVTKID